MDRWRDAMPERGIELVRFIDRRPLGSGCDQQHIRDHPPYSGRTDGEQLIVIPMR
jgi:hypothetical protein